MACKQLAVDTVAEAYLALLAERSAEYLFANAGTPRHRHCRRGSRSRRFAKCGVARDSGRSGDDSGITR